MNATNKMMPRRFVMGAAIFALAVFGGCGDSDVKSDGKGLGMTVETVLTPQLLVVGQATNVSCPVFDQTGSVIPADTRFSVSPVVAPVGNQITPMQPGEYTVTCALKDGSLVDTTPVTLWVVSQDEADLVVVETLLDKTQSSIDEPVGVSCGVALRGTLLAGLVTEVTADPSEGIRIEDHTVTGLVNGDFAVACKVPATTFIDESPVRLTVGEGAPAPARIVTTLTPATIAAGETAMVNCTVLDANGQETNGHTEIEAPPGVVAAGSGVTGQQSGDHVITCVLAGDVAPVEEVPATLTVTPGAPTDVEAWIEPLKAVYRVGDVVTVAWQGRDSFENPVSGLPATITAPSAGVTKISDTTFTLVEDGFRSFGVRLDSGPQDTVEITVDTNGPTITILSPERGQTYAGDGQVMVTGSVQDNFGGVQLLTVNGQTVTPSEAGTFSHAVSSVHGMNPIVVRAADGNGNVSKSVLSWYYSSDWIVVDEALADEAWLPDAVRVWLSQTLIDDGDHEEETVDDLAHLLELVMAQADLGQMLGQPVAYEKVWTDIIDNPNFGGTGIHLRGDMRLWAEIETVTFGDVVLSLDTRDGGLDMDMAFTEAPGEVGLHIGLKVHVSFDLEGILNEEDPNTGEIGIVAVLDPPPTITTSATLSIQNIEMSSPMDVSMAVGEALTIDVGELQAQASGWEISPLENVVFDLGSLKFKVGPFDLIDVPLGQIDLTGLVSGINTLFQDLGGVILDNSLEWATDTVSLLMSTVGATAVEGALRSLEWDQDLAVPQLVEGDTPKQVALLGDLSSVVFTEQGAQVGVAGRALATRAVDYTPIGSILRSGCLGSDTVPFALPQTGTMEFALSLDLMNEVVFGMWNSGGLNVNVDLFDIANLNGLGVSAAQVTMEPTLPPVLTDCNNKGTLRMQVGDTHLDVSFRLGDADISFQAWVSAEIDVILTAVDGNVGILVSGASTFDMEVFDQSGPVADNLALIETLVQDIVIEKLLAEMTSETLGAFPMPTFEVGAFLGDGAQSVSLGLQSVAVKKSGGFVQIEGDL